MSPSASVKPQERNVFAKRAQRYAKTGEVSTERENFVICHEVSPKYSEVHVMAGLQCWPPTTNVMNRGRA